MNKEVERIEELRYKKEWSVYKLAKMSGVAESTINKWINTGLSPTVDSLRKICKAFGMTLADFFLDVDNAEMVAITPEIKLLYNEFNSLTPEQRQAVISVMRGFTSANKS